MFYNKGFVLNILINLFKLKKISVSTDKLFTCFERSKNKRIERVKFGGELSVIFSLLEDG